MSEMEDKIGSILNDPESMEKISRLAQQLMGGGSAGDKEEPRAEPKQEPPPAGGLDPEMLGRIGSVMAKLGSGGNDDKTALLKAISPYLAEKRRDKLAKAMQIAKMARLAGAAFGEMGGKGDGD